MKRPPQKPGLEALGRLQRLAEMLDSAARARIAPSARRRSALRGEIARLGRHEDPMAPEEPAGEAAEAALAATASPGGARSLTPGLIRARIAHRAWLEARRAELNQQLAEAEAEWHILRPSVLRAAGRAQLLSQTLDTRTRAARDFRAARARGDPDAPP